MSAGSVPEESAVFAIADTHFGLRERGRQGDSDSPAIVADFLRWIRSIPEQGREIRVLDNGAVAKRLLHGPSKLILLGDIIELWDAENLAVLLSSVPVGATLATLDAEKIYVLGNHDSILKSLVGAYPFGLPDLNIVEWVYPVPAGRKQIISPMTIGTHSYIFIHGHQLDIHFRRARGTWRSFGHIRQFGAALGIHAWWFLAVTMAVILVQVLVAASLLGWILAAASALIWIPRFVTTYARRLWRAISGRRFKRSRSLNAFRALWKGLKERVEPDANLGIVYGHTHFLDYLEIPPEQEGSLERDRAERKFNAFFRRFPKGPQTFYNISSWVSTHGRYETVIWATIFYADANGPIFLGWDWNIRRPFHVPFEFVERRRRGKLMDSKDAAVADELQWPPKLIEKWRTTSERVR